MWMRSSTSTWMMMTVTTPLPPVTHTHKTCILISPSSLSLSAVAVLFTMEDSSKVFAIGNIEQVAVADGTVDARRATGSSSAEYLRQLSMSQQQRGLHQWPQGPLYPPVVP